MTPTDVESMDCEARLRYWEEEWLSELLEEALRLKGKASDKRPARKDRASST